MVPSGFRFEYAFIIYKILFFVYIFILKKHSKTRDRDRLEKKINIMELRNC